MTINCLEKLSNHTDKNNSIKSLIYILQFFKFEDNVSKFMSHFSMVTPVNIHFEYWQKIEARYKQI